MTDLFTSQFRRSLRGYDPEEVNGMVAELTERLTATEEKMYERERALQQALRELADANQKIARNSGSFSDLGTEFESALRLAEEQAAKLRFEAERDARELVAEGRAQADIIRDRAHWDSKEVLAESTRRAEAILLKAEGDRATSAQASAEEVEKAKNARLRGERAAITAENSGRKRAAEVLAQATADAETMRREAEADQHAARLATAEARAEAERVRSEVEAEWHALRAAVSDAETDLRRKDEESAAERALLHERAQEQLESAYAAAEAHIAAANARAKTVAHEADELLTTGQKLAADFMQSARSSADRTVSMALTRANAIASVTEPFARMMLQEAEMQMGEARHRQKTLEAYSAEVRTILSTESHTTPITSDTWVARGPRSIDS
jgi:hypothetical protein